VEALADRSRRPLHSPRRSAGEVEEKILALRREHPTWGGRKLRARLRLLGQEAPSASTCTEVVRRAGMLGQDGQTPQGPWQRFERAQPNELWQMDFKGHFPTQIGARCHPLTILDDHSRFNLLLSAQADQTGASVKAALIPVFSQYGLPEAMLCDNGEPWGNPAPVCPYTTLTAWLLRLGVRVYHGKPYHPQTQGKEERFHRTLQNDLIVRHTWRDLQHCREAFERFRHCYNTERPHQALGDLPPLSRYRASPRSLPAALLPLEYDSGLQVRTVRSNGAFTLAGQTWYAGRAFAEQAVGLRPSAQTDGLLEVFFGIHLLGHIDQRAPLQPKHRLRSIYTSKNNPNQQP
jgi:transposase InsO family protein